MMYKDAAPLHHLWGAQLMPQLPHAAQLLLLLQLHVTA